jgi:hypothetical protein
VIDGMLPQLEPAHVELMRQAAQGDVVYNDDSKVRILELMGKRAQRRAAGAPPSTEPSTDTNEKGKRTGLFTSGIISTGDPLADSATTHRTSESVTPGSLRAGAAHRAGFRPHVVGR